MTNASMIPADPHESVTFQLGLAHQTLVLGDCFEWLRDAPARSIHSVVTDPPFGLIEYSDKELAKKAAGRGGIWRIPPRIGGSTRSPMPRFTVLSDEELRSLYDFFVEWATLLRRVLVPGAHVFVASTTALHHIVFSAIRTSGLEDRGEVVRLVRTLRGGNRPKGSEQRYDEVASMLRSGWEPWGVFREPFSGTLADNLDKWGTGGVRRNQDGTPLADVIVSGRTPRAERDIAGHPSLKPQGFLRVLTRASLPLGRGVVLDPFAGAGSTVAAAAAVGYDAIGIEQSRSFYEESLLALPRLAGLR